MEPARSSWDEKGETDMSPWLVMVASLILGADAAAATETAPKTVLLWPNGTPSAAGNEDADQPSLTIYLPQNEDGSYKKCDSGVVVCPGGGYGHLAMDHEGKQIAEYFNSHGVAAFVLKYRLGPRYRHPSMMNDVQRAIRYVRMNASELGISPKKIGVMGFSAGGHLASTAATHFDAGDPKASEPVDRLSSRPDFAILVYPVITFTNPAMHKGSRKNLLGDKADDPEMQQYLSNELQVTDKTPPTFLMHTTEDTGVPPENSILFYQALVKAKVPAEMHVYEKGRHGLGLAKNTPGTAEWSEALAKWMQNHDWMNAPAQ